MLSPEQIQSLKSSSGTPAPVGNSSVMDESSFSQWAGSKPEAVNTPEQPPEKNIFQKVAGTFLDPIAKTAVRTGEAVAATGLKAANAITGGAIDKFTPEGNLDQALNRSLNEPKQAPGLGTEIKPINQETPESIAGTAIGTVGLGVGSPALAGAVLGLGGAMERNAGVGEAGLSTVLGTILGKTADLGIAKVTPYITEAIAKYGTPLVEKLQKELPEYAKPMLDKIITAGKNATAAAGEKSLQMKTSSEVDDTINAVNPDLSGKKLTAAYKNTVTGKTEIKPSGIFKEQGLTPDEQTIKLGTRLHENEIKLSGEPVKDLQSLNEGLTTTEAKLDKELKGNPEIIYTADKPTLFNKLEAGKKEIPREFSAIKENKKVYEDVINFAKEKVGDAEDTIQGLRDARSSFDAQAKKEYPSAFKEGSIDTKTPAGRAIKYARDSMNEHLYDTAPNGSEIQRLIGLESDIFRATENIAPKAAKGEGKSSVDKLSERFPKTTKVAKGAALVGAGAAGIPLVKELMH